MCVVQLLALIILINGDKNMFKLPTGWKLFRRMCIAAFLCFVVWLCKEKSDMEYEAKEQAIAAKPEVIQPDTPRKKSALIKIIDGAKKQ
jgi:hypothetical protein